jgi:hypothetical protein
MSPSYYPTDRPHGTLLIQLGRRDEGLINKPPELDLPELESVKPPRGFRQTEINWRTEIT